MTAWSLVTGGSRGLGAEVCRQLAAAGHHVVVHYCTDEAAAIGVCATCRDFGVNAEMIQGDFSTREGVTQFIRRYQSCFPETCCLVNNASIYLVASLEKTAIDQWFSLYQTNLNAPYQITAALLPELKKAKGSVINIGVSGLDTRKADTYSSVYTMTKQGLYLITRSLAKELATSGVRVNMVSPGMLERSQDSLPALPMGRPATFNEAAQAVLFLLAPNNTYITGQNLEVAGGLAL